jgi:hypothetical protein
MPRGRDGAEVEIDELESANSALQAARMGTDMDPRMGFRKHNLRELRSD